MKMEQQKSLKSISKKGTRRAKQEWNLRSQEKGVVAGGRKDCLYQIYKFCIGVKQQGSVLFSRRYWYLRKRYRETGMDFSLCGKEC